MPPKESTGKSDWVIVNLVDVHCHLQADVFKNTIDDVVSRAESAGVSVMITNAAQPDDWDACRSLAARFDSVHFALGIHPWYIPSGAKAFLSACSEKDFSGAVALGEIGLDRTTERVPLELQIDILRIQLDIAHDLKLPVILHCRGAWGELFSLLKKRPLAAGGVVHAFSGSEELAADLVRFGLSLSIGGTLTYRDSQKRARVLKKIYPAHFMLETDSPDILPREKDAYPNEPANILYNLYAASEILAQSRETVAAATSENARMLFRL